MDALPNPDSSPVEAPRPRCPVSGDKLKARSAYSWAVSNAIDSVAYLRGRGAKLPEEADGDAVVSFVDRALASARDGAVAAWGAVGWDVIARAAADRTVKGAEPAAPLPQAAPPAPSAVVALPPPEEAAELSPADAAALAEVEPPGAEPPAETDSESSGSSEPDEPARGKGKGKGKGKGRG